MAAFLTYSELIKPNSKNGQSRIDILKEHIINSTELYYDSGLPFKIDNNITNLNLVDVIIKTKKPVYFISIDGKKIKSNSIIKSSAFGGAFSLNKEFILSPAETTAIGESIQCYTNALCSKFKRKINHEDINLKNLNKVENLVDVDRKPISILDNIKMLWLNSSIKISNCLYEAGLLNDNLKYHRGSEQMNCIYSYAQQSLKNSNVKLNNDKWNPGDIWAISKNININEFAICCVKHYNENIKDAFNNKEIISISLKLVKDEPNIKIYNNEESEQKLTVKETKLCGMSKKSNFFSAGKVSIILNEGSFEGRAFQYMTNWSFEILGTNARAGKIGLGIIITIIENLNISVNKEISKDSKEIINSIKLPTEFIDEWYNMYTCFDNYYTKEEFHVGIINKHTSDNKNDLNWLWSKYIGTYILFIVYKEGLLVYNNFINNVIKHAESRIDNSSIFMKVY